MENIEIKKCSCLSAFSEGIGEKSFENDFFSIFGQIVEEKSIVIKYHGNEETTSPEITVKFDENEPMLIKLAKCEHGKKYDYCTTLSLENYRYLNIKVNNNFESCYAIKIMKDPLKKIIERYALDRDPEKLPTVTDSFSNIRSIFYKFLSSLKNIFNKNNVENNSLN